MVRKALEWLGLVEENREAEIDYCPVDLKARRDRFMERTIPGQGILICRGEKAIEREKEIADLLHKGKMVIVDLRNVELQPGQRFLDRICGALHSTRGRVVRVAPFVFLAVPSGGMLEVWKDENEEMVDS